MCLFCSTTYCTSCHRCRPRSRCATAHWSIPPPASSLSREKRCSTPSTRTSSPSATTATHPTPKPQQPSVRELFDVLYSECEALCLRFTFQRDDYIRSSDIRRIVPVSVSAAQTGTLQANLMAVMNGQEAGTNPVSHCTRTSL